MAARWRTPVVFLLALTLPLGGAGLTRAQGATATVRIALLPQWVVNQHRAGQGFLRPGLRSAVDDGVVDRVVFAWQRGFIQRQALVWKPIRILPSAEAAELGGRGEFELVTLRPPRGRAAWTEVEVALRTSRPDDALVLEVGGELNTVTQVLETVATAPPGGGLREAVLAPTAVVPGEGVPVLRVRFGRPVVVPGGPARFREADGLALLVARSQVQAIVNADVTANGFADSASLGSGDWREGDRVFIRLSLATLRAGAPGLVLGWKDRTLRPDPEGGGGCSSPRC